MAQHDYDINSSDSISGLQFRQDVNAVLSAIKSSNSGATAPTTYIAGTLWLDTSTTPHILKKRNTANTGWDTIRIEDALGAPIASGATTTVGAYSGGNTVHITGTTTITSLGVSTTGTTRTLIFDSALTLTHNATSLICPNALSITTVSGDAITVVCEDGALGYWKVSSISRLMPSELSYLINATTAKTTPVDADKFGIWDSVSGLLNSVSLLNFKNTIFSSKPLGSNFIMNGGFDYWNYATSQTITGYGSDDRWSNNHVGSTKTHSQVASTDTERALFSSSKFSRTVVTSIAGAGNYADKRQSIENVTKLAGKTATISFWAKANANKNIAIELLQVFGTGGTPSATVTSIGSQLVALTTTWQKKTITVTIPSIIGKTLGTDGVHTSYTRLGFWFDAGSNFNANTASLGQQSGTFDIAEVKLEEGSAATPWTPYEGEFGGEVQACQRYYEVTNRGCYGAVDTANTVFSGSFLTRKRTIPTLVINTNAPQTGLIISEDGWKFYYISQVSTGYVTSTTASAEL